jgi:hypothetical protein
VKWQEDLEVMLEEIVIKVKGAPFVIKIFLKMNRI